MEKQKGKLVVIEGTDGSGKTDATNLLVKRLKNVRFKVVQRDFPSYGKPPEGNPASYFVRKYLRKPEFGLVYGYGPSTALDPKIASQFYALERFDAAYSQEPQDRPNLIDQLGLGNIVISNRYVESNIGHQGSKIKDPQERKNFMLWVADLEYGFYKVPRPDLVVLLDIHPDLAIEAKQKQRQTNGQPLDGHEVDENFIRVSRETYLEAAELFRDYWEVVPVWTDNNGLAFRDHKDIQQDIWSRLTKHRIIL